MPVQHIPPANNSRSQKNPAVLTPTARAPLDRTPSVRQLSANMDRGLPMEGAAPSRRSRSFSGLLGGCPGMSEDARTGLGEGEDSGETEMTDALADSPEVPQGSNLALSSQPLVSQTEPSLLKMMEQLTQAVNPMDNSKAPSFKTPSMKAPDSFNGTQAHKFRGFIQSCQLIYIMIQKISSLTGIKFFTHW
ncbi:hypothetical protein O181_037143 [Austropuccinia psidii MF-1]|uniref:Uncharacterized protein n=1 Tax=Austropuccinia psidii MF-1 TaxID=1389203 RepID=A0A9Q3DAU4_9BASI|nr:hypothetical protein [Austropuccinia psidii MF-1]